MNRNSLLSLVICALAVCMSAAGAAAQSESGKLTLAEARAGDPFAQTAVAVAYMDGTNGFPRNHPEGMKWMQKAADQKYPQAQFLLGMKLYDGVEVERDLKKAVNLFSDLAKAGNAKGQRMLGVMHMKGDALPQDDAKAAYWLKKGAKGGDALAMLGLSKLLLNGRGVKKDNVEGMKWAIVACFKEADYCSPMEAATKVVTTEENDEAIRRAKPLMR